MDRRFLLLALAGLPLACAPPAAQTCALADDDVAALRQHLVEYSAAATASEIDRYLDLFADDAVRLPPNRPAIEGREANRALAEEVLPLVKLEMEALDIDGCGDIGIVRGAFELAYGERQGGATDVGKFVSILRRGPDGQWRISVNIWNLDLAPAESEEEET